MQSDKVQSEQKSAVPQNVDENIAAAVDMRERLNQVSTSFCLAKWYQVSLLLQSGHTHSCHHPTPHKIPVIEASLSSAHLHNTVYKKSLRKQMLKGERPKECEHCWHMEDLGQLSDRHFKSSHPWAMPHFAEALEAGAEKNVIPRYLEVSFDNICNFKCAYCSAHSSSRWLSEIKEHGPYPTSSRFGDLNAMSEKPLANQENNIYVRAFWRWWPNIVGQLDTFRITGGEPLLSDKTWKVLTYLQERSYTQLKFALNSNMGVPAHLIERLGQHVNELEGRIQNFTLFTSMDTVGEQAEYIRYGLDFELYTNNLKAFLLNVKWHIRVVFMVTVNALSISGMAGLVEKVIELKREFPQHEFGFDTPYLRHPEFLSVKILSPDFNYYLENVIRAMTKVNGDPTIRFNSNEVEKVQNILKFMQSDSVPFDLIQTRKDFAKFIVEYDVRRKLNFNNVFPEYADFLKMCKELNEPTGRTVEWVI